MTRSLRLFMSVMMIAILMILLTGVILAESSRIPTLDRLSVAVIGDLVSPDSIPQLKIRIDELLMKGYDDLTRPNTVEVVPRIPLQRRDNYHGIFIKLIDPVVEYAASKGLFVVFRLFPHIMEASGEQWEHPQYVNVITGRTTSINAVEPLHFYHSIHDQDYVNAVYEYVGQFAEHYRDNPAVIGYITGWGMMAEDRYLAWWEDYPNQEYGAITDFCESAQEDYERFVETLGFEVSKHLQTPRVFGNLETMISLDPEFYLWIYWRALRLDEFIEGYAAAIKANHPESYVGRFNYLGHFPWLGFGGGLVEESDNLDFIYGTSMEGMGYSSIKQQDAGRPNVQGYSSFGNGGIVGEVDNKWAQYTIPSHTEAYIRYMFLMGGMPRAFLPTTWNSSNPGAIQYSPYVGLQEVSLINGNMYLNQTTRTNDIAIIIPSLSTLGIIEPTPQGVELVSEEWQKSHGIIQNILRELGAGYDTVTEDAATAERLDNYKLVITITPAMYPNLRKALDYTEASVLVLGWAGTIKAPSPTDASFSQAWDPSRDDYGTTVFPTGGKIAEESVKGRSGNFLTRLLFGSSATIKFENSDLSTGLLEGLEGEKFMYEFNGKVRPYVCELEGTTILAVDGNNRAVYTLYEDPSIYGKEYFHVGFPPRCGKEGHWLLSKEKFTLLIHNILNYVGATVYRPTDLGNGALNLYETNNYLLVDNPFGTNAKNREQAPYGDFEGIIPFKLKNPPLDERLLNDEGLYISLKAGESMIIPLGYYHGIPVQLDDCDELWNTQVIYSWLQVSIDTHKKRSGKASLKITLTDMPKDEDFLVYQDLKEPVDFTKRETLGFWLWTSFKGGISDGVDLLCSNICLFDSKGNTACADYVLGADSGLSKRFWRLVQVRKEQFVANRSFNWSEIQRIAFRFDNNTLGELTASIYLDDIGIAGMPDLERPAAPSNLRVEPTDYWRGHPVKLALGWEAAVDDVGISGYEVYRNGQSIGSTSGTVFIDSNFGLGKTYVPEGSYTYQVRAFDLKGNYSEHSPEVTEVVK